MWEREVCPQRYVVILRGTTVYAPPVSAMTHDKKDASVVTVKIQVPDPGHYQLFAWPDFDVCPHYWRANMTYSFNRGQVFGTPLPIQVTGKPSQRDSFGSCQLDSTGIAPVGRWISRTALQPAYRKSKWMDTYPRDQEHIYQPFTCKRHHYDARFAIDNAKSVSQMLFLGDSVIRGSFCSQIWPQLSDSGMADGQCTYINSAAKYHVTPKDTVYQTPDGRDVRLSFRFMYADPEASLKKLERTKSVVGTPSHVVANAGLWVAPRGIRYYRNAVKAFLIKLSAMYPDAMVIWRTTMDVAPMIQCFSDKSMTRGIMADQRAVSLEVIGELRSQGYTNLHVVDAYAITEGRPDTGNDGRHWVAEVPRKVPDQWAKSRPHINHAEWAALDAVWDLILRHDETVTAHGE